MLSEKYIWGLIKEYANSPEGKAEIKKKYGIDFNEKDFKIGTSLKKIPKSDFKKYGEQMKQILYAHINPLIKSITLDDIVVGSPQKGKDGQWNIMISFREGSLHRDSLDENDYPEGLNNIVLLFAKGYHARDYVYGLWNTTGSPTSHWVYWKDVRSRKDRGGNDFLIQAVNEFNAQFGENIVKAELLGDYKECSENPN